MRVFLGSAALAAAATVCALALTGCGAPATTGDPTDTTSTTTSTEPTTTEPTDTTEPTGTTEPTDPTETTEPTDPTETTEPTDPTDPTDPPGRTVNPQITLAEVEGKRVHVSATIRGVNRADGTCTLTAEHDGDTATASQPAVYNVNRTECGGLYIKITRLGAGEWTLTVAYEADGVSGTGDPVRLEVR